MNETGRGERARLAHVVFEALQVTPRWQQLFERVRRIEARVAASEKRHEAARREQADKIPAYERDPLFRYLARRRYGTATAAGNPVARGLDRWVAGVVQYDDARAKYDFLNELPDHAAGMLEEDRRALAAAVPPLTRLENEVIDRNGLTPVLERIRDEFEANDWNGRRSRFDDSLDINALLLGYLAGSHSSGHMHRLLGHHQHFLPVGDGFGSAGTFGSGGGFGGSSFGGFGGGEGGFPPGAGSSPAVRGRLRASTESGDVSGIPATPNRLGASHGTFPGVIQ